MFGPVPRAQLEQVLSRTSFYGLAFATYKARFGRLSPAPILNLQIRIVNEVLKVEQNIRVQNNIIMVISTKHYQSKKKIIFLAEQFHFLIKQRPQWHLHNQFAVFSIVAYFPVEYYLPFTFVLKINTFSGRTPKKNSMERKKIIVDLPFPCRETHVLIVKTLTSIFKQLPICDLGVVLVNYHAIEISSLLYNCPL